MGGNGRSHTSQIDEFKPLVAGPAPVGGIFLIRRGNGNQSNAAAGGKANPATSQSLRRPSRQTQYGGGRTGIADSREEIRFLVLYLESCFFL